jgi:hypothetical protein
MAARSQWRPVDANTETPQRIIVSEASEAMAYSLAVSLRRLMLVCAMQDVGRVHTSARCGIPLSFVRGIWYMV